MRRSQNRKMRSGFTLIEIGMVIIVGLLLIGGAIGGYKKIYLPMKGDVAFSQISSVIDAVERSKGSNSNVYPTGSTAKVSSIDVILNELGGASNSADVADWTFDCSAGSGKTATLVTTAFSDPVVANIASTKITNAKSPWSATVSGSVVTATIDNVVCQ